MRLRLPWPPAPVVESPVPSLSSCVDPVAATLLVVHLLLLYKAVRLWCRGSKGLGVAPRVPRRERSLSESSEVCWPGHGSDWFRSPPASEKELAAIQDAKARLPPDALTYTLGRAIAYGRYMVKEMIGVVQLKKYRTMKKRYVPDD